MTTIPTTECSIASAIGTNLVEAIRGGEGHVMTIDVSKLEPRVRREINTLRKTEREVGASYALNDAIGRLEASLIYLKEMHGSENAEWYIMQALDHTEALPMPELLATARPPEFWSECLSKAGAPISAATIKKRAMARGLFHMVRQRMLITPGQLDFLFRVNNTDEARAGRAAIKNAPPSKAYLRVLARLMKPKKGRLARIADKLKKR